MNVIGNAASTLFIVAALVYARSFATRLSGGLFRNPGPAKRKDIIPAPDIRVDVLAYATEIQKMSLYSEFNEEVPFHNIEHGNNIREFASWYALAMEFDEAATKILEISAISHDLMHPGLARCPKNDKASVSGYFLNEVRQRFGNEHSLERFAEDVWAVLKNGGVNEAQMQVAFAHGIVPLSVDDPGVPLLMVARAPQEILHAWVTIQLLHEKVDPVSTAKILINILMTSISLQFTLRDDGGAGAEAEYVRRMCQDPFFMTFQCGLLLHLLDMGWCTQGQCANDGICTKIGGVEPSLVFGPRFLAESSYYKNDTLTKIRSSEEEFVDMVTELVYNLAKASEAWGNDLNDLEGVNATLISVAIQDSVVRVIDLLDAEHPTSDFKTMSPWMFVALIDSALSHKGTIGSPQYADAVVSIVKDDFGWPQSAWMKEKSWPARKRTMSASNMYVMDE